MQATYAEHSRDKIRAAVIVHYFMRLFQQIKTREDKGRWGRPLLKWRFCVSLSLFTIKIKGPSPLYRVRPITDSSAVLLSKGRLPRFPGNPVGLKAIDLFRRRTGSENHNLFYHRAYGTIKEIKRQGLPFGITKNSFETKKRR